LAKVILIAGLCGAGKNQYGNELLRKEGVDLMFDEGYASEAAKHEALVKALLCGKNCVSVGIFIASRKYGKRLNGC